LPQKYRDDPDKFYQWIALVSDHVHRITLMAYDYHGAFDRPKLTGVNAPLYRDYNPKSTLYIENSVDNYLKNKVPQGKILLGMPLYGRGYQGVEGLTTVNNTPEKPFQSPTSASKFTQTPGLLAYSEIQNLIDQSLLLYAPDIVTDTARAYSVEKKVWYSFDNPQTLKLKAAFAMKKQLKGAIFWSIDMDGIDQEVPFPNIRAVKEQFDKNEKD
jgi:chitinase